MVRVMRLVGSLVTHAFPLPISWLLHKELSRAMASVYMSCSVTALGLACPCAAADTGSAYLMSDVWGPLHIVVTAKHAWQLPDGPCK